MNTHKMTSPLKLIAMGLITISYLGMGCTSLQQTTVAATDDLYYTPNNRASSKSTAVEQDGTQGQIDNSAATDYQDYQTYPDDRYLRLKVANRNRWDAIDDFGYWNDPRYNYAYYPSYGGWNSWYSGFYGASWYNPFGISMGFGWGGYAPYMNSYYSMGWGFNDFGYGGWNPYYAGYWNPYGYYYPNYFGGGYVGSHGIHYQYPNATRLSAPALSAYRNTATSGSFNNTYNNTNGNTRYTGNANLNNNFGSLLKRVVTTNNNVNFANSWDRPARYFNNGNNNAPNQVRTNSTTNNTSSNNNTGGKSGGYNSSGSSSNGGRASRVH